MLFPSLQYLTARCVRPTLPRLLTLALPLAFGACESGDGLLAPADAPPSSAEALAPALASAEPDLALATTGQRILFSSSRKGTFDLFKSDPQGNNVVRLTSFADYEGEPAWSWDNKRIAMIRPRLDASKVKHADIYLMNADGTNKRWALSAPSPVPILHPAWSPDGTRLLVTIYLAGGPVLATLKPATGELAFVIADGQIARGSYASYDVTGQKIIYIGSTGTTIDQIHNGVHSGLFDAHTPVSFPDLSPDGKKIAYTKTVSGNADIYVWTLGLGTTKRLTTHANYDGMPTWSPDGSKIAFESARSGWSQIWTMNAATGGSLTRITHTATGETYPAWSH